jgi:molybdenum cofactor biosynthesis protein MoaC
MKDVSSKPNTLRTARAEGTVRCRRETIEAVRTGRVPKADPIGVAKVAGIQAAKNTSQLIPYCHQVPLDFVGVEAEVGEGGVRFTTEVRAVWKTGVEMEAMVAASAAALTFYDMVKAIDESMEVHDLRLLGKTGGVSVSPQSRSFSVSVLVISDSTARGERKDESGRLIREFLESLEVSVRHTLVVQDDASMIEQEIIRQCDEERVDVVVTTGGTGLGPRDVTPEATRRAISRERPGIEEFVRAYGQERTRTAMLGRGVAGVRGNTIVVNLPGSPAAVRDSLPLVFPWVFHGVDMIRGDGH